MKEERIWRKDKDDKWVPCDKRLSRIIPHHKGPLYLLISGEKMHAIEHPDGCLIANRVRYSFEKKTDR